MFLILEDRGHILVFFKTGGNILTNLEVEVNISHRVLIKLIKMKIIFIPI